MENLRDKLRYCLENETYEVYEKVDGSLSILYKDPSDSQWKLATRGSFTSEQAKRATDMFNNVPEYKLLSHAELWEQEIKRNPEMQNYTLCFEVIYPENRMNDGARLVCNYGTTETLVLLGAINKITGKDLNYDDLKVIAESIQLPITKRFNYTIDELVKLKETLPMTEEGWVIRFESGFRMKVKGNNYLKMHKILNGVTALNIWEMMKDNNESSGNFEVPHSYKVQVPEEILKEVNELESRLKDLSASVRMEIGIEYNKALGYATENYPDHINKGLGLFVKENDINLRHKTAIFLFHKNDFTALNKYINMNIRPTNNHIRGLND